MTIHAGDQRPNVIRVPGKPLKRSPDRLPWPRISDDAPHVPLGVDVKAKYEDIRKIVHKFFRVPEYAMEELIQEVCVAILNKNTTRSAHDQRKSSFGHYVYMIADNVCINIVHRMERFERRRDSIDAPSGHEDSRSLLEMLEDKAAKPLDETSEFMDQIEVSLRSSKRRHLARYMKAARSGADSELIRLALTFGNKTVSTKDIRNYRSELEDVVRDRIAS